MTRHRARVTLGWLTAIAIVVCMMAGSVLAYGAERKEPDHA